MYRRLDDFLLLGTQALNSVCEPNSLSHPDVTRPLSIPVAFYGGSSARYGGSVARYAFTHTHFGILEAP